MGQNSEPFTPMTTGTVSRTVTGTSASVALYKTGSPQTVEIQSPPANSIAFIEFGDLTVAAVAATGYPIMPGVDKVVAVPPGATHVAAIGTSGTTLYFSSGHGA